MKIKISSVLCVILAVIISALSFAACGVDPNVNQEDKSTKDYSVKIDDDPAGEKELEGFHSYGAGKIDPVTVDGVEVNVSDFALRSFELAYMLAQKSFSSASDIPIDALVQFAFTHVYFKNLNEITNNAVQYRDATDEQIKEQLRLHFGSDNFDITKSVLYNPSKKIFEMWIPEYGCNIYYRVDAVNVNGNKAEIITTFFNELKRETLFGKTTISVAIKDGKPVIDSLVSE